MGKLKLNKTLLGLSMGLAVALAIPASWANTIYTFSTSGTAASDGRINQSTAVFDFTDANTLKITLTNDFDATTTLSPPSTGNLNDWGISSVLDGLDWSMSATATTATLTNVTTAGVLDCTDGSACVNVTASESSPYNWLLGTGTDWLLAPNGFKPDGIVNNTVVADTDGMSNTLHNNYLLGPVSFDITLTGLSEIPTITDVAFAFGTAVDWQQGSTSTGGQASTSSGGNGVPEPSVLALLGFGMLGGLVFNRKRKIKG